MQKRALIIIFGSRADVYTDHCVQLGISTLYERREMLSKQFFKSMLSPSSCLHYLLPEPRDSTLINKLRNSSQYLACTARTDRFNKSFIQYAINNYQ